MPLPLPPFVDIDLSHLFGDGIPIRTGRPAHIRVTPPPNRGVVVQVPQQPFFMPHHPDQHNTVDVKYQLFPRQQQVAVTIRIEDKEGEAVFEEAEDRQDDGDGLTFTWDGRLGRSGYIDVRKSPYRVTIAATDASGTLPGFTLQDGSRTATGEVAGPVEVVGVPALDHAFVVSRGSDGDPLTLENKIIEHGARPTILGIARAVVGGVRASQRGTTHRAHYTLVEPPAATASVVDRRERPIQAELERWDEELWPPLTMEWQKVMPLGLHSPAYRPTQNQSPPSGRATRHGEFTNVVSNGPTEGQWVGKDIIEYQHIPAGTGGVPEPDNDPGTVRWQCEVDYADDRLALNEARPGSPGKRNTAEQTTASRVVSGLADGFDRGLSGAGPAIHRIGRRGASEVTMLSYLELYRRVPWIYGSLGEQVDEFIGYDCADLATGAARKGGLTRMSYTNANNLCNRFTQRRGQTPDFYVASDGTFRSLADDSEITIGFGGTDENHAQLGDIVFFNWDGDRDWDHTTILWENPGNTLTLDTLLVWAHHDLTSTDGFYIGPLRELTSSPDYRIAIRHF